MILRIVAMKVCGPRRLELEFNNGVRKRVDVSPLLEGPVFEPLRANKAFARAKLDKECGTVVWPNGADFAPETLFDLPGRTISAKVGKKPAKQKMGR